MTIPKSVIAATQTVVDFVRGMSMQRQQPQLTAEEAALGPHLRGNTALYESLVNLVQSQIAGRARVPEPSDPLQAKSSIARDRECQRVLARLELVYHSPVSTPGDNNDGELPEN